MNKFAFLVGLLFLLPGHASADVQIDEHSAAISWKAFYCASLASSSLNIQENNRLFMAGYDHGKGFIEAFQRGEISGRSAYENAPGSFISLMEGSTVEFMLGQMWHAQKTKASEALDEIIAKENLDPNTVNRAALAEKIYFENNCQSVAR